MTVDVASFRASFPEFGDATAYPNAQVQMWLDDAALWVPAAKMGARADLATMLYVGHSLTYYRLNTSAAASGGAPGQSSGVVTSKSVGPVSVSYDTASVIDARAGEFNSTNYGRRLWTMLKSVAGFSVAYSKPRFR
jgi:hypothetical protein